jgi:N-acetylglutamate synthase-like GNAT family acetyltransferase
MNPGSVESDVIVWHEGPRAPLRHLFELADDSSTQIDSYIDLGRVLVARTARGEILGHLQLIPTASTDTVELKSIAVRADQQRRGIGRRLVNRALAICREDGVQTVTVTTATADLDNLRFYQRCGFRATTIERDVFTEATGYPPQLVANGIPVRDSITFTLLLDAAALVD